VKICLTFYTNHLSIADCVAAVVVVVVVVAADDVENEDEPSSRYSFSSTLIFYFSN
jgi:hypothetical protein